MKSKRGVQPVVATALLVGFAVSVTAVVMIFGTDYVKDIQRKQGTKAQLDLDCNNIKFDVTSVTGDISLRNTGSRTIDAFAIVYYGSDANARTDWFPVTVPAGDTAEIPTQPPGGGANNIKKVDLIPKIEGSIDGGAPIVRACSNAKKSVKV